MGLGGLGPGVRESPRCGAQFQELETQTSGGPVARFSTSEPPPPPGKEREEEVQGPLLRGTLRS